MSSYNGKRFTFCGIREGVQKKESFPNVFTHPPTQGFLRDLGKRKLKFGSKKAIFAVILRGLGLVWESATLPTHIWERSPKKNVFFYTFPYQGCTKDAKAKSQLRNHGTSHVMRQNIVASIERLKNTKRKNVMKLVFFMGGVHFANKNAASLTRNTRLPSTFWVAF